MNLMGCQRVEISNYRKAEFLSTSRLSALSVSIPISTPVIAVIPESTPVHIRTEGVDIGAIAPSLGGGR